MKVIVTTGHPDSGCQDIHQLLCRAGMAQAQASRREGITPEDLQARICSSPSQGGTVPVLQQQSPGTLWQELAVDLFMANQQQPCWGWSDFRTVPLLQFWKTFDAAINFVLVYAPPASVIRHRLRTPDFSEADLTDTLAEWSEYARELLRFYNRNQDRCLLVHGAACDHAAAPLYSLVTQRFGVQLDPADPEQIACAAPDELELLLAGLLAEPFHEAYNIYQELESSADLPAKGQTTQFETRQDAWKQYLGLLNRHSDEQQQAKQASALAEEQDKRQAEAVSRLHQQILNLTKVHEKEQEQKNEAQQQLQKLTQEINSLSARQQELMQQLKDAEAQVAASAATAQECKLLKEKQHELAQENELLLLQLHQVQEELEHYFLQYQDATAVKQQAHQGQHGEQHRLPDYFSVDLRDQQLRGTNWYYAEHDGRWAGPETTSTIQVPRLEPGDYLLQLTVVDAMSPELLSGMTIQFNEQPVTVTQPRLGKKIAGLFGRKKRYPARVEARIRLSAEQQKDTNELTLVFPRMISPAERGADDQRRLAVRVRSVRLLLI